MKTSTTIETLVGSHWEYDGIIVRIVRFGAHPTNLEPLVFCKSLNENKEDFVYAYDDFFDNFQRIK